ncbi:hypothetical protein ACQZ48_02865 [Agrobacterium sp. 22-209-1]
MQYNPPFGSADPNAPYKDRNTAAGEAGSRVPAAAIEDPQREIMAVIAAGGIAPSKEDLTQLLQAIQQLISAATGGGDTSNFVLMPQARARLPIFPEVLTSDGRIPVISPAAGQVRVPAGYDFLHRGIFTTTTVQADFATAANKTYHLRWTPAGGFTLKDLADAGYNPTAAAEGSAIFDSSFDDMIIARVVTSAANVPTITNLGNKHDLRASGEVLLNAQDYAFQDNTPVTGITGGSTQQINWARRPSVGIGGVADFDAQSETASAAESNFGFRVVSRYTFVAFYQVTGNTNRQIWMTYEARA